MKHIDTTLRVSSIANRKFALFAAFLFVLIGATQTSFSQWTQSSGYNSDEMRGFLAYPPYLLVDVLATASFTNPPTIDSLLSSTDNGQSWSAFAPNGGVPLAAVLNGGLPVLIGTASYPSGGGSLTGVLSYSADFGKTWQPDTLGFPSSNATNHLASALVTVGNTIFASDGPFGLYMQSTPGSAWMPDTVGLSRNDTPFSVNSMIVNGNNIFLSTSVGGTFISTNVGVSWTPINTGMTSPFPGVWAGPGVGAFAISGSSLFAMVPKNGYGFDSTYDFYRTTNNGQNWTLMNQNPLKLGFGIERFAASSSALFAASDTTVNVSTDNGATWFKADQGLPIFGTTFSNITAIQVSGPNLIIGILTLNQIWYRKLSDFSGAYVRDAPGSGSLALSESFPNPLNTTSTIDYTLPKSGVASLKVFDVTGKEIAVLVEGYQGSGNHTAIFSGASIPAGVYYYRLTAGEQTAGHWMQLIK